MKRIYIILLLLVVCFLNAENQKIKAIWATVWSIDSPKKIDSLISDCKTNGINTIYAQVRYRGDAMYIPNKTDNTYYNPDPRCYLLKDDSFDALQYLLDKADGISIHAWVTTFVVTTNLLENLNQNHMYFSHPQWVTADEKKIPMQLNTFEGLYFDPGIEQVRKYTQNVLCDIVKNYNIAGLHLDYVRYPQKNYGYNSIALKQKTENDIEEFKQNSINIFVKNLSQEAKRINPKLIISAAIKPKYLNAKKYFAQNWLKWVKSGWIDYAVTMNYEVKDELFEKSLTELGLFHIKSKLVIGHRAWKDSTKFSFSSLQKRLKQSKPFLGISFFSYSGLKKSKWLPKLLK